jgi:hypothetical protein
MIPMEDILTKYLAEVDNYASDTSKENEPQVIEEKQEEAWNDPEPQKEEQTIPEFTQYDPQPNLFQQDDDPFDKKPEVSPQEMDDPFISPQINEFENNEPEKLRVDLNQEKIKVDLPTPEKNFFSDSD